MRFRLAVCLCAVLSVEMVAARTGQSDHVQQVATGSEPAVATDAAGVSRAAFVGGGERAFYVQRSNGVWTAPISVARADGGCSEPEIAVESSGSVCLVWNDAGMPHASGDVMFSRSSDGGRFWYTPVKVSVQGAAEPALAIGSDNSLHSVWLTSIAKGKAAVNISSSSDHGNSWSKPEVVAEGSNLMSEPAIAVDGDGTLHVVWIDRDQPGAGKDVHYTSGKVGNWTPTLNLSRTSKESGHPRIVCGGKGKIFVAWSENDEQSYNVWCAAKNRRGGFTKFKIADGPGVAGDAFVSADALGKVAVTWTQSENGKHGGVICARLSRNALDEISNITELAKSSNDPTHCAVTISGNRMVALWEEDDRNGSVLKSTSVSFSDFPTGPATPSEGAIHPHHGY